VIFRNSASGHHHALWTNFMKDRPGDSLHPIESKYMACAAFFD
jgi:hypothetical protein